MAEAAVSHAKNEGTARSGGPMAKATVTETRRVRYEQDLYAWTQEQASFLRMRQSDRIDWENLAEEIAAVGRSDYVTVSTDASIAHDLTSARRYLAELSCALLRGARSADPRVTALTLDLLRYQRRNLEARQ